MSRDGDYATLNCRSYLRDAVGKTASHRTCAMVFCLILIIISYIYYFIPVRHVVLYEKLKRPVSSTTVTHTRSEGQTQTAVAFVACGSFASGSLVLESIYHIYKYSSLPVYIYTDMPGCFDDLNVNIIRGTNCTTRFGSNLAKQSIMLQLLAQYHNVLYLDADVLVTKNFRKWTENIPYVPPDTIVFARERSSVASSNVSGGAMLVSNNSLRCIHMLRDYMIEHVDNNYKMLTYSDQKSYSRLVQQSPCSIGLMEPGAMCFGRAFHCVVNSMLTRVDLALDNTVFMHYTTTQHSQYKFKKKYGYGCMSLWGTLDIDCYTRVQEHTRYCASNVLSSIPRENDSSIVGFDFGNTSPQYQRHLRHRIRRSRRRY